MRHFSVLTWSLLAGCAASPIISAPAPSVSESTSGASIAPERECLALARRAAPTVVARVLGDDAVVRLEERAITLENDGMRTVTWRGTVRSTIDGAAARSALEAEDSDRTLHVDEGDSFTRHAVRVEGSLRWDTALVFDVESITSIKVSCTEPIGPIAWATAAERDLVTDVVPQEVASALRHTWLARVSAGHDGWMGVGLGSARTLHDVLLQAGWSRRPSAEGSHTAHFQRDGAWLTTGARDGLWLVLIGRDETPRPEVCIDPGGALTLFLDVDESRFALAGTDGQRWEARTDSELRRQLDDIRMIGGYVGALRLRSELAATHPRIARAWAIVRDARIEPTYCTEERAGRPVHEPRGFRADDDVQDMFLPHPTREDTALEVGSVTTSGNLSRDEIEPIVHASRDELRACGASGASRVIGLWARIARDGGVQRASIYGASPPVAACLTSIVERWTFPEPPHGIAGVGVTLEPTTTREGDGD